MLNNILSYIEYCRKKNKTKKDNKKVKFVKYKM